jgi:hypothetical protein
VEFSDGEDLTGLFLRSEDSDKLWRKVRRRKESVKIHRMRKQYKKIREAIIKVKKDNQKDLTYMSGMQGPGGEVAGEKPGRKRQAHGLAEGSSKPKKRATKTSCKQCGSTSHSRITSLDCTSNPKNTAEKLAKSIGKWQGTELS